MHRASCFCDKNGKKVSFPDHCFVGVSIEEGGGEGGGGGVED